MTVRHRAVVRYRLRPLTSALRGWGFFEVDGLPNDAVPVAARHDPIRDDVEILYEHPDLTKDWAYVTQAFHETLVDAHRTGALLDDEALVFALLGEAGRRFFDLEREHPDETEEFAAVLHILQRMVMARPTRRLLRRGAE